MVLVYVSALIALLLTLILGVPYLGFLKTHLYKQYIREDGPASHAKKAGTPTTGGIVIVIPALIGAILSLIMDQKTYIDALIVMLAFGLYMLIGYRDDIIKITRKHNKGLGARTKLLIQILVALIPALYITYIGKTFISVFGFGDINLGILYPFFAVFIIVGFSNAVNLTDGLDGLAAGTSAFAFAATAFICLFTGKPELAIISAAIAGSCLGFLYYNLNPAKVFMGDTGSLALGGALGTLAVIGKFELLLLIIGIIFVLETLSVILQVISFKTTGKRIFKMSPIHHHFELSGWSEKKVMYAFWFIGIVAALAACVLVINQS